VLAHDSGFGIARYTADGALDPAFGTGGLVVTRSSQGGFVANALALQPDGKIVIAGMASDLPTATIQIAVARFNADGTPDKAFGVDGLAKLPAGPGGGVANAIALQLDGALVVAGTAFSHGNAEDEFAVARFLANGHPDAAFGTNGLVSTHVGAAASGAQAVALQPDGAILVAGTAFSNGPTDDDFALARYLVDGTLDAAFGSDGIVTTDFGSSPLEASLDRAAALTVAADGKIVVGGSKRGERQAMIVARYHADGSLDHSFGSGGKVQVEVAEPQVYSVAASPSGDLLLAGSAAPAARGTAPFAVVRLHADGTPDSAFGTSGLVTTSFEGSRSGARAVAIEADGKLLTAGAKYGAPSSQGDAQPQSGFALARYLANGNIDPAFGVGGRVLTDLGDAGALPLSLVVQPDGKVIAAGLVFFQVSPPAPPTAGPLQTVTTYAVPAAALALVVAALLLSRVRRSASPSARSRRP
jgi:uncharacterized delta-60 repeat protein